ncbi:hypothetical protein L1987_16063 [Smallanthus sonchifolius]|uniref:Uncharacterized protein n=1 Tax=Smallanthus sonchifolius TaxID=185202 RepID=A0ACB9J9F9_9ASTR|nr:hypothetical protein L1987_16063 [Smallanthus sonchifolius]
MPYLKKAGLARLSSAYKSLKVSKSGDKKNRQASKAGPGTISEALIRGLPIILNDYIPGQVCKFYFYTFE